MGLFGSRLGDAAGKQGFRKGLENFADSPRNPDFTAEAKVLKEFDSLFHKNEVVQ